MAKKAKNEPENVFLEFALSGLEEVRGYSRQRPGTTAQAYNVRGFEPGTDRARGGSRAGLTKYLAAQVNGSASIQCVDHLVTATSAPPQTFNQFLYAEAFGSGFGIANNFSGASLFAGIGAVSGYQFANSCWDVNGNLYVATINLTTGLCKIYCVASGPQQEEGAPVGGVVGGPQLGSVIWTSVPFAVSEIARGVAGMCVVGSYLFVALKAPGGDEIIRLPIASTGSAVAGQTWQKGFTFSTNANNCLSSIAIVLGVENATPPGFYTYNATLAPSTPRVTFTPWVGTANASASKVVSDGVGFFYGIASIATGQLFKIGVGGNLVWTSSIADSANSLAYDQATQQLLALCQTAPSVRSVNITTGGLFSNVFTGTTIFSEIGADNNGNFVLWQNSVASGDVEGLNQSLNTRFGPATLANALHNGCSVNPGSPAAIVAAGPRDVLGIVIAGGTMKTFTPFAYSGSISTAFSSTAPVIRSAQNGLNIFFVDGTNYLYWSANTRTVQTWVASTGGSMPVDTDGSTAQLIVTWRGRTGLYGFRNNPQLYYLSAVDDPFNMNFAPQTTSTTQAFAGTLDFANQPGQFLNCLIPYDDNTLLFGLSKQIWQCSGDPAAGGQFNIVSREIGMAWGAPWCIDEFGQIYFLSNQQGIFKATPGALPVLVSQAINRRLQNIDLTQNVIRLAWDTTNMGLGVWVTPLNQLLATTNYFWERRTNAWWPDFYFSASMNPLAVHAYKGANPTDQTIFLGGRDGYLRIMSNAATSDDGQAIKSSVMLGPLPNKNYERQLLLDLLANLSDTSGPVTYSVFVGETPQTALASAAVCTGTWVAGRNAVSFTRWSGMTIYIQLSAVSAWAMEYILARLAPMGMEASRMYMGQPAIASPGVAPTAPTGLAATAGTNQVSLAFNLVIGATSYNLYRGVASGNENPYPIATGITSSPYVDSTAVAGTAYFYYLTAVNAFGESPASNEAS